MASRLLLLGLAFLGTASCYRFHFHITEFQPDEFDSETEADLPAHNISVPVDHFHNESIYEPHSSDTFPLRYWFDAQHYRDGGPVIILAGGETSGADRIPFLKYGILSMLANATGGIAVILEHRYYGTSFPVPDLTPKNMRFLTTEQALADTNYFARNVRFPGLDNVDLTAASAPYIIYGGSYAGAFAAFARKVYPDTFWGAIGSSAVTEAIVDYWEYYEAARHYAPGNCANITQQLTQVIDRILLGEDRSRVERLKDVFGLGVLDDDDFANVLSRGISGLQNTNWDPQQDTTDFGTYCASVSSDNVLFGSTRQMLPFVHDFLDAGGCDSERSLANRMLNFIGYVRNYIKADMAGGCRGQTIKECYSAREGWDKTDLTQYPQRSWIYQVCTQWGYFQTGSGALQAGVLPLISRLIDLKYTAIPCRVAFNITTPPNVASINRLGGFNFHYPRVAFIDGEEDPWRAATPHRDGLPPRASTVSEPFILIEHGVHHWDENGVRPGSGLEGMRPKPVQEAQEAIVKFVKTWLKRWHEARRAGLLPELPQEEL